MEATDQLKGYYRGLTVEDQKHFISRIVDLLLYNSYFCDELIQLVTKYESKKEDMQNVRRKTHVIQSRELSEMLPNKQKVQPKEDFTQTSKYQTVRETKGVLPFEDKFFARTPGLFSSVAGLHKRIFRNTSL